MDLKEIQEKLKNLRDRIKAEGHVSADSEEELKTILGDTLISASQELETIQNKLAATMAGRAGNDNHAMLTEEQKKRLQIIEKTGTGSHAVH